MHDEIEQLLREKGELGVNAIAQALQKPVSTTQKCLEKQSYFIRTQNRKWDLPERVLDAANKTANQLENNAAQSRAKELALIVENVIAQVDAIKLRLSVVGSAINELTPSPVTIAAQAAVANSPKVNSKFEKRIIELDKMHRILKAHIDRVPDKYKALLTNLDYSEVAWQIGATVMDNEINPELTSLILGEKTELQESTIALFEQYQLGRKKSVMSDSDGEQSS